MSTYIEFMLRYNVAMMLAWAGLFVRGRGSISRYTRFRPLLFLPA